jgi:hypothetical protein
MRYLGWVGIPARVFNVGSYRRFSTPQPQAGFFDPGMAGSLTFAGDETLASGREAHHDNTYL